MTDNQTLREPLAGPDAKRLAIEILQTGAVEWPGHVTKRLADHRMTAPDVENIIKGGWVDQVEPVREGPWYGCWRYRFTTREMATIIQFGSATEMSIVTAWRL
jgi:hypothetical protein